MYVPVVYVVTVSPCYVLLVFYGVCVTVPTIPIFSVAPDISFCVPYKVIALSSNDYAILCTLMRSISYSCQVLGVLGVGVL